MKEKVEATFTKLEKASKSRILMIRHHLMPYPKVVEFTAVVVSLATAASPMVIYFIGSALSSPSSSDGRMP